MSKASIPLMMLLCAAAGSVVAAQVRRDSFGCKSLANTEHLIALQQAPNQSDYHEALRKLLGIGECRLWQPGIRVVRKDWDEDLVCVAEKGSGVCYWSAKTLTD